MASKYRQRSQQGASVQGTTARSSSASFRQGRSTSLYAHPGSMTSMKSSQRPASSRNWLKILRRTTPCGTLAVSPGQMTRRGQPKLKQEVCKRKRRPSLQTPTHPKKKKTWVTMSSSSMKGRIYLSQPADNFGAMAWRTRCSVQTLQWL